MILIDERYTHIDPERPCSFDQIEPGQHRLRNLGHHGGKLEIAKAHGRARVARTTGLYDRRHDAVALD
jgi:hypothetical protein